MNRQHYWRLRDAMVCVVLVLLLGDIALFAELRTRSMSDRTACAGNLREIGQAFLLYANDNKG